MIHCEPGWACCVGCEGQEDRAGKVTGRDKKISPHGSRQVTRVPLKRHSSPFPLSPLMFDANPKGVCSVKHTAGHAEALRRCRVCRVRFAVGLMGTNGLQALNCTPFTVCHGPFH